MPDDTNPTRDDTPTPDPHTAPELDELFDRLIDAAQRDTPLDLDAWLTGREHLRPQAERLARVAAGVTTTESASRPSPPGFTIIEEIGRGGMGVVYRARQHSPKRTVALKVTRATLASPNARKRFELETELLARLEHPGIARIYASGIDPATDEPFFAMELVEGLPIDRFAETHALSTRRRLDLLRLVCDAVEHAHQKGIVHRDLKPSNILIDQDAHPRVLDFGVARLTDADVSITTLHTDAGALIGTIPYMSPEQAGGDPADIDTRSDVYALGVLAYKLLTGRLPYDIEHKLVHEAVRVIREQDPTPLSSTDRTLRGDVQTIIAKALEKEKPRRYQSAAALADDIQRLLSDVPIAARPPSATYQFRKFARRNRGVLAAASVVLFVLVAGATTATIGWARALSTQRQAQDALIDLVRQGLRNETDEAIAQRAAAAGLELELANDEEGHRFFIHFDAGRQVPQLAAYTRQIFLGLEEARAEEAERAAQLQRVADFQAAQLAELEPEIIGQDIRRDLLEEVRAALQRRGDTDDAVDASVRALDRSLSGANFTNLALRTFDRSVFQRTRAAIDEQFADQPGLRARLLQTLAYTLEQLGLARQALDIQRAVLALHEGRLDEADPERLQARANLAQLLMVLGELEQSEEIHEEVLAARRHSLGEDHPETLTSMVNLAEVRRQLARFEEAESMSLDALDRRRAALGEDHADTLVSYANHAVILSDMGRLEERLEFGQIALEGRRRAFGPEHVDTLNSMNNVGYALYELGRHDEAEAMLREAYETRRRVLGDDHAHTLVTMGNLADVIEERGDLREAMRLRRERLEALERTLGELHPYTLSASNNLAISLLALDEPERALPLYERVIEGRRALYGDDHPDTLNALGGYGTVLRDLKRVDEAETVLRKAVEGFTRVLGPDHPKTLTYTNNLGLLLQDAGKLDDAIAFLRAALEGRQRTLGSDHIDTLAGMANLGNCLRSAQRFEEAEGLLAVAVDRVRESFGDDHWYLGVFLGFHARALTGLERFADAEARYIEGYENLNGALGPDHRRTRATITFLADMYDAWHEDEPDAGHDASAEAWRARLPPEETPAD